jgi:hypothetical protein
MTKKSRIPDLETSQRLLTNLRQTRLELAEVNLELAEINTLLEEELRKKRLRQVRRLIRPS